MTLLLLCTSFTAGCVSNEIPEVSPDDREFFGIWTQNATFLANGDFCNAVFTFRPDGTGLREIISATTGKTMTSENLTWKRTGESDTLKIIYEDGFEEITSLRWIKGTW